MAGSSRPDAPPPADRARIVALLDFWFGAAGDVALPPVRRRFVYMPFMHSENLADQQRSLALFETMQDDPDNADSLAAARRHRGIIARFGRFPHRNAILGRTTTPDEAAFLAGPDAGF
jgi:uncharacterized protein (DUF924 family)